MITHPAGRWTYRGRYVVTLRIVGRYHYPVHLTKIRSESDADAVLDRIEAKTWATAGVVADLAAILRDHLARVEQRRARYSRVG